MTAKHFHLLCLLFVCLGKFLHIRIFGKLCNQAYYFLTLFLQRWMTLSKFWTSVWLDVCGSNYAMTESLITNAQGCEIPMTDTQILGFSNFGRNSVIFIHCLFLVTGISVNGNVSPRIPWLISFSKIRLLLNLVKPASKKLKILRIPNLCLFILLL